jgi:hypothetical protein
MFIFKLYTNIYLIIGINKYILIFIVKYIYIMIEKVKLWIKATGLTNVGWAAGFAGASLLGWWFAAGVCVGIFVHLNYSVIKDIVKDLTK